MRMSGPMLLAGRGAFATWDQARTDAGITLLNDDQTAQTGSGTVVLTQATRARSSGKLFWGVHIDVLGAAGRQMALGFATTATSTATYAGEGANSYGWWGGGDGGNPAGLFNNGASSVIDARYDYVAGETLLFAQDIPNGKAWLGELTRGWIDGDPATGLNPSWTGIAAGTYAPVGTPYTGVNKFTLALPTAIAARLPSGYQFY